MIYFLFFFHAPAPPDIYTLSLHDALPIYHAGAGPAAAGARVLEERHLGARRAVRSEEHTSELQSRPHLVCRLLLEKKKNLRENTLSATDILGIPLHRFLHPQRRLARPDGV